MDCDQDIYAVNAGAYEGDNFQNIYSKTPWGRTFIGLTSKPEGTTSNQAAIGARSILTLEVDEVERKSYHKVGSGASIEGNSLLARIGEGRATQIRHLEVT